MTDLAASSLTDFTAALASDSPAPGGGSASAAAGAAGAALLAMVVGLTVGKEKYRSAWDELSPMTRTLDEARRRLLELVDADKQAYDAIVTARRLPKTSDEEKTARAAAIDGATVVATTTPMQTAFFAEQALALAPTIAEKGNPNAASDTFVAALLLSAAVEGALANVRINLPGVGDSELARGLREDAEDLEKKARAATLAVREIGRARTLVS